MKNKILKLNPKDLKNKSHRDFADGIIIKVRKYFIWIKGNDTYANTEESMVPLKQSQMPQYIKNIVF